MVTSLDDVQPLELASIRDDARERRPWTSRATVSVVLAVVALALTVIAALVGDRVPLGPGRVLSVILVGAWALAAVFVAVHRPREPLAEIMALAAIVGAALLLGAALAGRNVATDTVRDFGSGVRGGRCRAAPGRRPASRARTARRCAPLAAAAAVDGRGLRGQRRSSRGSW